MTYDLALFQSGLPAMLVGRKVTGAERLAQRVQLILLTKRNAIPRSTLGCDFLTLTEKQAVTEADIRVALSVASLQVARQVAAVVDEAVDTDSDKLDRLRLKNITISDRKVQIELEVLNLAGETADIQLPLTFAR
jgi:hypothetical protein